MDILVLCRTLCPFHAFLRGEPGDRIQIFPELFIRIDNHIIACTQVRFCVNNHRFAVSPDRYIESLERT